MPVVLKVCTAKEGVLPDGLVGLRRAVARRSHIYHWVILRRGVGFDEEVDFYINFTYEKGLARRIRKIYVEVYRRGEIHVE